MKKSTKKLVIDIKPGKFINMDTVQSLFEKAEEREKNGEIVENKEYKFTEVPRALNKDWVKAQKVDFTHEIESFNTWGRIAKKILNSETGSDYDLEVAYARMQEIVKKLIPVADKISEEHPEIYKLFSEFQKLELAKIDREIYVFRKYKDRTEEKRKEKRERRKNGSRI